ELLLLTSMNFRVHQSMQTFSLEEFFNEIDRVLAICSIRNCHIVMYPEALVFENKVEIPEIVRLIYSKQDNQIEHYLVPLEFPSADLIPGDTWKSGGRTTRVFKPLFFRNEQLGYVVFEPLTNNVKSFEAVRGQISNMLKVINLLLRQKEIEGRLAKAVGDLQEFNRTLNILSIRDELTSLLNRRGFFDAVQNELDVSGENVQEFLVIFADIDGMKSINDVYGHEEGDAAIRNTAEMLRKVFRADDVIARMGGDEFIVYARHAAPSFFEKVQERAELVLAEIRAVSPKPYRLSVSLGCACFDPHTPLSLSELLREADQHLYEEKRRRKEEAKASVERG
ncbi:MAG TPA: GGDEF domain-containing protein, partial [Clostridia bacterium]